MTIDNFDLSSWTQEQRDLWLGGAHKAGADHVQRPAAERGAHQKAIRANQAASVAGPYRPCKASAWQLQRIADEKAHAPAPRTEFDPAKFDPAKPFYEYDPATYDPDDYAEWKLARLARHPLRPGANPFGPDSNAAVHIKQRARGIVTAIYNGIVQFIRWLQR